MFKTNLRKVGGSTMLAIPPALLDVLHLHAGSCVGLSVDAERLVVDPAPVPKYTLEELLAQCDEAAEPDDEERAWLNNAPVGDELI